jgi:glucan phosphoethanolaminetransferase (alkaline phosphatase superfamily)
VGPEEAAACSFLVLILFVIGFIAKIAILWTIGISDLSSAWEVAMRRIGSLLVIIWLVIGVVAAVQRNYFSSSKASCAKLGTIAVTIVAGPLNYAGVNPKVKC